MSRLDAIKALRMKLAAKKVAGRYKGKSSIGGEFRSAKPFNPNLHPRGPGGKFTSTGGAGKSPSFRSREERILQQAANHGAAAHNRGNRSEKDRRAANKEHKEYRERLGLTRDGKNVDYRVPGKLAESRLARAKELRAQRAAKQAESAKPARASATDRANRLVKKISERAHTMEPSTIDRRVNRIGKVLNAKELAAVEKNTLSANVGKTKAEKLAEIRRAIHNRRKSRDRVAEIQQAQAPSQRLPDRTHDTMSDAIAIASPNGRMSKRAQHAAQERLRESLFGKEGLRRPEPQQPTDSELSARATSEAAKRKAIKKMLAAQDKRYERLGATGMAQRASLGISRRAQAKQLRAKRREGQSQ